MFAVDTVEGPREDRVQLEAVANRIHIPFLVLHAVNDLQVPFVYVQCSSMISRIPKAPGGVPLDRPGDTLSARHAVAGPGRDRRSLDQTLDPESSIHRQRADRRIRHDDNKIYFRVRRKVEHSLPIALGYHLSHPPGRVPVGSHGRTPAKIPLSGPRPEPSEAAFSGLRFSRRNCRPERMVEAVLADLLPHWGYENDPVVVAEVITTLRLMRSGLEPCGQYFDRPGDAPHPLVTSTRRDLDPRRQASNFTTHLHWQCRAHRGLGRQRERAAKGRGNAPGRPADPAGLVHCVHVGPSGRSRHGADTSTPRLRRPGLPWRAGSSLGPLTRRQGSDLGCGHRCGHSCGRSTTLEPGPDSGHHNGHSGRASDSDSTRAISATFGTRRRRPSLMTGSSPRATSS